jgi:hypothetical protein
MTKGCCRTSISLLLAASLAASLCACGSDTACGCLCSPEPDGDLIAPCSTGFAADLDATTQDLDAAIQGATADGE